MEPIRAVASSIISRAANESVAPARCTMARVPYWRGRKNSQDAYDDLRRGRLEAAMIAVPNVASEGMSVTPVARDELVYISADPTHLESPVTARRLSEVPSMITGLADSDAGIVVAFTCWCGAEQTMLTGAAAGRRGDLTLVA